MTSVTKMHRVANEIMAYVDGLDRVLCNAFGVERCDQVQLRFLDHIPYPPITIPLMRLVGGPWAVLLADMEKFTEEQKTRLVGAGAGIALDEEGKKAVKRATADA
jgi:hypothetical protein